MKKTASFLSLSIALLALLIAGCDKKENSNNSNTDNFDRKAMLSNYADNYIIPAYGDIVSKLTALKGQADAFNATPNQANLGGLRTAFVTAYTTWQRVEMLEMGPAEELSLRMYINTYPVSLSKLNANIGSGQYDLESFGNKDAQGFPAVDYLINGLGSTDQQILDQFTTDAAAAARKQYLSDVVGKMLQKLNSVEDSWSGGYRNAFVESTGTDASSSLSNLVNSYVLYFERYLRSGKIGLPVGAMTGVASPQLAEAYYTPTLSKTLALEALDASLRFYEGRSYDGSADGIGLKDYLAAIGTKDEQGQLMAEVITNEMTGARTALSNLPNEGISYAVTNNRTAVLSVYDELQAIIPLLKVDMVSALGISITYVDNDGD